MSTEPDEVVDIPQPVYPDETPAEALEAILKDTLDMAEDVGRMTRAEATSVLQKVLEERLTATRRATFKLLPRADDR